MHICNVHRLVFVICIPHETITIIKVKNMVTPPPEFPCTPFLNLLHSSYCHQNPKPKPLIYEISLHCLKLYVSGITHNVSFLLVGWEVPHFFMIRSYPCIAVFTVHACYYWAVFVVCMYHGLCLFPSSLDEHVPCFQFWIITNKL